MSIPLQVSESLMIWDWRRAKVISILPRMKRVYRKVGSWLLWCKNTDLFCHLSQYFQRNWKCDFWMNSPKFDNLATNQTFVQTLKRPENLVSRPPVCGLWLKKPKKNNNNNINNNNKETNGAVMEGENLKHNINSEWWNYHKGVFFSVEWSIS